MHLKKTMSYYNDIIKNLDEQGYSLCVCDYEKDLDDNMAIYKMVGYPRKYDIRDDFAFQYNQDIYNIVSNSIHELYGDPIEKNSIFVSQYEELKYEKWILENSEIYNYFFNDNKTGNNYTYLKFCDK